MSNGDDIYWVIPEPTAIKHGILRRYLGRFMGVFFSVSRRIGIKPKIVFVDGFAGPGLYFADEQRDASAMVPGSPMIVGELANGFRDGTAYRQFPKAEAVIIGIEASQPRAEALVANLDGLNAFSMPWHVWHGEFEPHMERLLDYLEQNKVHPAPMFVFIDPFGFSGIHLVEVCRRLFAYERVEVFFNFMFNDINRFLGYDKVREHMIAIFGSEEGLDDLASIDDDPEGRAQAVLDRLVAALREHAPYVLAFRMNDPDRDRPKYFLVHASSDVMALKLMKDSMYAASDIEGELSALSQAARGGLLAAFQETEATQAYEQWILDRLTAHGQFEYEDGLDPFYLETTGIVRHYKAAVKALAKRDAVIIEHIWDKNRRRWSFRELDDLRLPRDGETYDQAFKDQKEEAGR